MTLWVIGRQRGEQERWLVSAAGKNPDSVSGNDMLARYMITSQQEDYMKILSSFEKESKDKELAEAEVERLNKSIAEMVRGFREAELHIDKWVRDQMNEQRESYEDELTQVKRERDQRNKQCESYEDTVTRLRQLLSQLQQEKEIAQGMVYQSEDQLGHRPVGPRTGFATPDSGIAPTGGSSTTHGETHMNSEVKQVEDKTSQWPITVVPSHGGQSVTTNGSGAMAYTSNKAIGDTQYYPVDEVDRSKKKKEDEVHSMESESDEDTGSSVASLMEMLEANGMAFKVLD